MALPAAAVACLLLALAASASGAGSNSPASAPAPAPASDSASAPAPASAPASASASAPAPAADSAPAPAANCIAAASSLIDCMGYVSPDSTEKSPSRACCGEVKAAVADPAVVDCLCTLAGSKNLGIPIDMKRVASLPGACGASNFVSSKCHARATSHSCRAVLPSVTCPYAASHHQHSSSLRKPPPPPPPPPHHSSPPHSFPAPLRHPAPPLTRAERHHRSSTHGTHHRRPRRRRGVPPPRARRLRLRRGEGLALPRPGASSGLHLGRREPVRLPRLRHPGEHGEEPVQDLLRGGQDRRGQPRRRRLPLLPGGQQEPGLSHRHETRLQAPRGLRLVQHRLRQVPHFHGLTYRSTWSVCRWITQRRSDRVPAESCRELSDDGDHPRGRCGGAAARLLLPLLS